MNDQQSLALIQHLHPISVHAFYTGDHDAGRRACERILSLGPSPDQERITRRNRTWYTQPAKELFGGASREIRVSPFLPGWSLFNPSIISDRSGFLVNVRSSNYRIVDGTYQMPPEDNGVIKTENILVRVNDDLTVESATPYLRPQYNQSGFQVDGYEDCRLFRRLDGHLMVSFTIRNMQGFDGACRIGTCSVNTEVPSMGPPIVLPSPFPGRHEKNWAPLGASEEWVYALWEEGQFATVKRSGDEWKIDLHGKSPMIARGFRGGTQFVRIDTNQYIGVIHEVAHDNDGRRTYEHRFVVIDLEDGRIARLRWTPPFYFMRHRGIEFAAGIAVGAPGQYSRRVIVSFGVNDAEAWLADFSIYTIFDELIEEDTNG
jgi:predicted GH43/DUF377 family glycosyl hydrolase